MKDWDWNDLLALLRKRGWSLRQIAIAERYNDNGRTLQGVSKKPSPKAERILAAYAGMDHPMKIWPSRYDRQGQPNRAMGRPPLRGKPPVKPITPALAGNPQKAVAA